MRERLTTDLPLAALDMAVARQPPPAGRIHHSDRGGMRPSMGNKGECSDNAVVESLFSTLKRELMLNTVVVSRREGRSQMVEYLDIVYNRQRRHRAPGYQTPVEFEQRGNRAVTSFHVRVTEATSHGRS